MYNSSKIAFTLQHYSLIPIPNFSHMQHNECMGENVKAWYQYQYRLYMQWVYKL